MTQQERTKKEIAEVKLLGSRIGYGHLMELASALWREDLEKQGYPIIGAFVPTVESFIKDEYVQLTKNNKENYDRLLKSSK